MSGRSAVFGQSRSAAFATSTKAVAVFFCVISCGAQRPSPAEGSTKDRLTPTGMCDMAGGNDAFLECNGTALEDTSALVDQELLPPAKTRRNPPMKIRTPAPAKPVHGQRLDPALRAARACAACSASC